MSPYGVLTLTEGRCELDQLTAGCHIGRFFLNSLWLEDLLVAVSTVWERKPRLEV